MNFDGTGTSLHPQTISLLSGARLGRGRELPGPSSYFRKDLKISFALLNYRNVVGETRSEDGVSRKVWRHCCAGPVELEWKGRWAGWRNHGDRQFLLSGD